VGATLRVGNPISAVAIQGADAWLALTAAT
jgi:hypothetical protein